MGQGRTMAVLGVVVLGLAGAGLWFALDDGGAADDAPDERDVATAGAPRPADAAQAKTGRQRAKVTGTCAVTGVVRRRRDMAPAAGQTVELLPDGGDPWKVACDEGGAFSFEEVPDGGPYEVRVAAEGFAPVRLPGIALAKHERRDVGTLWLDRAVRVPVSVRTTADLPVVGALVEAFAAPEREGGFDWSKALAQAAQAPVAVARATTDAQGKVLFDGLAGGTWTFVATKAGLAREGKSNRVLRGGEDVPEVKIFLGTGHVLKGRVLDGAKQPIAGVLVLAGRGASVWDFGGSALRVRATSDAEGRYVLSDLPAGDLAVLAGRTGTAPVHVATVRVPAVTEFDILLRSGGSLSGTVTDSADGKPVEGAVVRASAWGVSFRTAEATTDSAGKYRIAEVPEGQIHDVRATKAGFVPDRRNQPQRMQVLTVPAGESATKDLRLRRGATLRGTVTGPGGPLAGARVTAQTWNPNRGVEWTDSVTTDASGKYEMAGAEAGKVLIQAAKEGHYQKGFPENSWMALQQPNLAAQWKVDVSESGETTFDVRMERGVAVRGRVEGPEGPLAGAKVAVGSASATSGDDGAFAVEGVAPGKPMVYVTKEGYLDAKPEQVPVDEASPPSDLVRRMVLQPVVRGRVTSAAGLPLQDAQVSVRMTPAEQNVWVPGWDPTGGEGGWSAPSPVRPDGTYETPLPAAQGKVSVRAAALDHATAETTVDVRADLAAYQADLALDVGAAVRGRVVSKSGGPVAGAFIGIQRKSEGPQSTRMMWRGQQQQSSTVVAVSGADGTFVVAHVAAGSWEFSASAEGFVRGASAPVKVPGESETRIELEASLDLAGTVVFSDGTPAAGAMVLPQKDGKAPREMMWDTGGGGGNEQATVRADGAFRLRNLAPGTYRLLVQPPWDGGVNVKTTRSDPLEAGRTDVRIVVEAGGVIAGRVVNSKKEGVGGVWVSAGLTVHNPALEFDPQGGHRSAATEEDGSFELSGLADGTWNVTIQPNQGTLRGAVVPNVTPGRKDLEIVLEEGLSIEGVVLKGDGTPVSEVWLHPQPKREPGDTSPYVPGGQGAQTDSDGTFTLTGLAPGRHVISIMTWSNPTQNWILQGGDDVPAGTTGLRLTVSEGEKISGVVVTEAGDPIAGASVNANTGKDWKHAISGTDGKFELTGLTASGAVRIHAQAPGRVVNQLDKVAPGTRDLRIVLEKGLTVSGRVVNASGAGAAGSRLHFVGKTPGARGASAVADAEGRFTCESLSPGEYEVFLMRQKPDQQWENVSIGKCSAGDTGVELRIP